MVWVRGFGWRNLILTGDLKERYLVDDSAYTENEICRADSTIYIGLFLAEL